MEHLTNCHGEWNALFALATSLPFLGTYLKYYWRKDECNKRET
jgi:hypothetical protein